MIQAQTSLSVADNSGAKKVMCIRVLGGQRTIAKIGDLVIGVVKEAESNAGIKKSDIVRGVVVRARQNLRRPNGMWIRFDENAVILVNKDGTPKGTRVFGPIARELRDRNFSKIVSLAPEVL